MKDVSEKEDCKMECVTFLQSYLKSLEKRPKIYDNIYNSYSCGLSFITFLHLSKFSKFFLQLCFLSRVRKNLFQF